MAVGPIPWRAIDRWCERKGLDRDVAELLEAVIARLDRDRAARLNRPT